jgi:pantothenate kinase
VQNLTGERAIHVVIFLLVLIGLCGISGWIIYVSTENNLLRIAGIALGWGIILLALYAGFRALNWKWWE